MSGVEMGHCGSASVMPSVPEPVWATDVGGGAVVAVGGTVGALADGDTLRPATEGVLVGEAVAEASGTVLTGIGEAVAVAFAAVPESVGDSVGWSLRREDTPPQPTTSVRLVATIASHIACLSFVLTTSV